MNDATSREDATMTKATITVQGATYQVSYNAKAARLPDGTTVGIEWSEGLPPKPVRTVVLTAEQEALIPDHEIVVVGH